MLHGRDLLPAIQHAVAEAGWQPADLGLLALSIGPGSFTGLRISVMFARTLASQTGVLVTAVPTLRLIAEAAPPTERDIVVITNAQRGGVYWARYTRSADGTLSCTRNETVVPPEETAAMLPKEVFAMGDGLEAYGTVFAGLRQGDPSLWRPRASRLAVLGWAAHLRGEHVKPEVLEPLYVRRPAPEEVAERQKRGGR
jgi:tRNA threonylcarbamoyladenosine biosynthesis protein TsaB